MDWVYGRPPINSGGYIAAIENINTGARYVLFLDFDGEKWGYVDGSGLGYLLRVYAWANLPAPAPEK